MKRLLCLLLGHSPSGEGEWFGTIWNGAMYVPRIHFECSRCGVRFDRPEKEPRYRTR